MSTAKVTNLQHASATSPNIVLGADGSVSVGGGNISPQTGFKNRIINGDMRIDQRNAGASVTPASNTYTVDRWLLGISQASKLSVQQNAGAVTPPVGFTNYLGLTTASAYTPGTTETFIIQQRIEGFNVSDLAWGTASAQSVTVSFKVRASITGTYGASIRNNAGDRSYPFSFSVSSANTWEDKTVTIPGDTTGTWLTNNGAGLIFNFSLGAGSSFKGNAGAWTSGNIVSVTGAVDPVATSGATFYITGVQLEKGTVATPFEFRSIGQELALCQRYYAVTQIVTFTSVTQIPSISFPVLMRTTPTVGTVTFTGGTGATYAPLGPISCFQVTAHNAQQTATIPVSAEL